MKLLADIFPVFLFFIVFKFAGIYAATAVAIAAAALQVIAGYCFTKKIDCMQWVTLIVLLILGSATLFLHNELFIKWKPTAIEWTFALIFLSSQWIGKKTLTERILGKNVQLPKHLWRYLNTSWVFFFLVMGALNIYVLYHFDTNTWVNFKLFGMLGCTILFVGGQAFYIAKHQN